MHKDDNIVQSYFSLLNNHINEVADFNNQSNIWLFEDSNDIFYEALTDDFFRKNLLTLPKRIMVTIQEISSSSTLYSTKLQLLSNVLATLVKR
jgi:hypothetical protein